MTTPQKQIDAARIAASIEQLQEHFGTDGVATLVAVLEAMKLDPQESALMDQLFEAFNGLGVMQGAVLTHVPYLTVIMSDDAFDNLA